MARVFRLACILTSGVASGHGSAALFLSETDQPSPTTYPYSAHHIQRQCTRYISSINIFFCTYIQQMCQPGIMLVESQSSHATSPFTPVNNTPTLVLPITHAEPDSHEPVSEICDHIAAAAERPRSVQRKASRRRPRYAARGAARRLCCIAELHCVQQLCDTFDLCSVAVS